MNFPLRNQKIAFTYEQRKRNVRFLLKASAFRTKLRKGKISQEMFDGMMVNLNKDWETGGII